MRYLNLFIVLFIVLKLTALSQTAIENQRDSLELLLNEKDGKEKVDIFNQLSGTLYRFNPKKALDYADSALALASQINYPNGEFEATVNNGSANFYLGNHDLTYKKYKEAESSISKLETPQKHAFMQYRLAIVQRVRGNFTEALLLAEESLTVSKNFKDTISIAKTLNVIGLILWNMERFDEAIEVNIETQKLVKDKYPARYAMSLSNTALIYDELGDHQKSIDLNMEALPIKEKRGDLRGIRNSYNNMALSYNYMGNREKSLEYQFKALKMDKQMGNTREMARAMDNIGKTYLDLNRPLDAKPYIEESYEIRKDQPDNYDLAEITKNMGVLNYKLKNYDRAEAFLREAVRISEACNCIEKHANSYKHLSIMYKEMGDYKKALDYYVLYQEYSDSTVNENVRNQISELETKYETEKKEQEIIVLNQEKQLAAVSLSNEKLLRNSFIGGTVTFLIVAVGLFNRYRYKSKTNKKLSDLNTKLTDLNDQLEDELNQAASYIESLLPPKISDKIKTDWMFIPSSQLGGDSFGYSWLSDNLFSFYLIDVSGHGVGAALLSTTVLNLLKSKNLPDSDFSNPASVLNSLNKNFDMEEHEGKYFAIWYGVLDITTNELTCASAMHPPALSVGPDGLLKLGKKDIMIGAFPQYVYENTFYQLNKDDKIFLFSDGCFEIDNEDKFEFDDFARLLNENSSNTNCLDAIYGKLFALNKNKRFEDDYSMLEISICD